MPYLCNLIVVPDSLVGFDNNFAKKADPVYKGIKDSLPRTSHLHIDETGWKRDCVWPLMIDLRSFAHNFLFIFLRKLSSFEMAWFLLSFKLQVCSLVPFVQLFQTKFLLSMFYIKVNYFSFVIISSLFWFVNR